MKENEIDEAKTVVTMDSERARVVRVCNYDHDFMQISEARYAIVDPKPPLLVCRKCGAWFRIMEPGVK